MQFTEEFLYLQVISDKHGLKDHDNYLTIPPSLVQLVEQKLDEAVVSHSKVTVKSQ